MATAHATWPGLDAEVARFLRGPMVTKLTAIGHEVVNEATALLTNGLGPAGVRVRTGRLRSSLELRVVSGGGRRVRILVGTRVKYAPIVHNGRGPVVAKRAKALRFTLPNGNVVIRKSVGPARPRPFLVAGARRALARHGVQLRVRADAIA